MFGARCNYHQNIVEHVHHRVHGVHNSAHCTPRFLGNRLLDALLNGEVEDPKSETSENDSCQHQNQGEESV